MENIFTLVRSQEFPEVNTERRRIACTQCFNHTLKQKKTNRLTYILLLLPTVNVSFFLSFLEGGGGIIIANFNPM